MTDARAPEQGEQEPSAPHHDLPRDAARPVQRARIRDAMSAARMAPVVSDPWADLRDQHLREIEPSNWGAARSAAAPEIDEPGSEDRFRPRRARRDAIVDLTDPDPAPTPSGRADRTAEPAPTGQETAVVALGRRQEPIRPEAGMAPRAHYGLGADWGSRWGVSTQGWVKAADGTVMWRPIVTTTEHLDLWNVDRYLGVVTVEVAALVETADHNELGAILSKARDMGTQGLVAEAVERGAHGVIGVRLSYTPVGGRLVVTLTGTAVTLREKRS